MSELYDQEQDTYDERDEPDPQDEVEPAEPVEIHRNGLLVGAIGVVAGLVSLAYLTRAVGGGSWFDWMLALAMGGVATAYLLALADSRTPLLVADQQGIRLRLGRTWRGVPWDSIDCVEHEPRLSPVRDGRLVLVVDDPEALLADLDGSGRRQVAITRRLHGTPLAVPLGLSTVVSGADGDLTLALERLAGDPDRVVEILPDDAYDDGDGDGDNDAEDPEDRIIGWDEEEPEEVVETEAPAAHSVLHDPRPTVARGLDYLADRLRLHRESHDTDDADDADDPAEPEGWDEPEPTIPIVASTTPLPLRDPVGGARVEVRFEGAAALKLDPVDDEHVARLDLPEADELRRPTDFEVVPIARPGEPVEPLVIEDVELEPAIDPVVGPELAAARTRLNLTVDELAERTRIRPHVIESIEVDDFVPCGGDFYARGHLRTLARVLGLEAAPLLAAYDDRYADAPIDARRVFEAELATSEGGPIRSTRGGMNWSVLVAAVMAVVLAWSIARLVMDSPVDLHSNTPVLNGSPSNSGHLGAPVPVKLHATSGGAHVVVRDGAGEVAFSGDLAYGEEKTVKAAPPVQVQSSDGGVHVTVDGQDRGPLGASGQPAQNTFAAAS